jgi:hypothetical protein
MLKQKKNLNFFKNKTEKIFLKKKFIKKRKKTIKFICKIERIKRVFRHFPIPKVTILKLNIRQNNIFATFLKLHEQKTLITKSSGNFKIRVSKKRLKPSCYLFLKLLFSFIKEKFKKKKLIIFLTSPRYLRRFIFRRFFFKFKKYFLIFCFDPKKCFNGCRAQKLKRKKYKKYRILK